MKVQIDRSRCQGHALCAAIAPEVFELDDDGVSQARAGALPVHLEQAARRGAERCPERAITLGTDD